MPIRRRAVSAKPVSAPRARRAARAARPAYMSEERYERRRDRRADIKDSLKGFMNMTGLSAAIPSMTDALVRAGTSNLVGKIGGMGDYKMRYNSIMRDLDPSQVEANYVPTVGNRGSGRSVRIRHREYIQDISSSVGFANTVFQLNPANSACFPWLSNIAQNFQEYRFHGMVFNFVSLSADALNSTNTALGAVIMSTDYNAGNAAYTSKQAAENSEFTVSSRPSVSLMHGIECDPALTVNQGHLYVSPLTNGTVPTGQDIKTYNMGLFQMMTAGSQAPANIGELWVSYDVELIKPIDNSQLNRSAGDHWELANIGAGSSGNGFLFGANPSTKTQNGIGATISQTPTTGVDAVITFPASVVPGQNYLILYTAFGTAVTITSQALAFSNCAGYSMFQNDALAAFASNGATSAYYCLAVYVTIGANASILTPATVTFPGASAWVVPFGNKGDLQIVQVPGNFNT